MPNENTTKSCPSCSFTKPIQEFSFNKAQKDGRSCECKMCQIEYARKYRNSKPGRLKRGINQKLFVKKYRLEFPLKVKAKMLISELVKRGKLVRVTTLKCVDCGMQAVHRHHHMAMMESMRLKQSHFVLSAITKDTIPRTCLRPLLLFLLTTY